MTDTELVTRIESLEARLMHQEASIDELTRTLLAQEQQLFQQSALVKQLEDQLKGLAAVQSGTSIEEPPPPHY